MSDQIHHECGLAVIRLLKPLEYYHKKYGTALYGLNKMQLLLQKQSDPNIVCWIKPKLILFLTLIFRIGRIV